MKTWKHCAIVCILTIIAFALIACADEPDPVCDCSKGTTHKTDEKCCPEADCKCPITREFKFPAGMVADRYMIVRDARTDPEDVDLETLGIITKLRTALDINTLDFWTSFHLGTVMGRNPEIIVEQTNKDDVYVYSGNKMRVKFSYVLTADADDLIEKLGWAINVMSGRTF